MINYKNIIESNVNIKVNDVQEVSNNNTKANPIKSNLRISFNMSEMELYRYAVRENIEGTPGLSFLNQLVFT